MFIKLTFRVSAAAIASFALLYVPRIAGQKFESTSQYDQAVPNNSFGTIYIARKSQVYGSGVTIYAEVNGEELGDLGTSEFLHSPAKQVINVVKSGLAGLAGTMSIGDNTPIRSFSQESKQDRYFLVSLEFNLFAPQILMEEVSESTWRNAAR